MKRLLILPDFMFTGEINCSTWICFNVEYLYAFINDSNFNPPIVTYALKI